MRTTSIILCCLTAIALNSSAQASLEVNGSFELGTQDPSNPSVATSIVGWTIGGYGVERVDTSGGIGSAIDGNWFIDLAYYTTGNGIISQGIPTVVNGLYELSFALGNATAYGRDGTGVVDVYIDGSFLTQFATPYVSNPLAEWQYNAIQFIAGSASTTVEFRNNQYPYEHFALLDDVSLNAVVPEAASIAVWSGLAVTGSIVALRKRK